MPSAGMSGEGPGNATGKGIRMSRNLKAVGGALVAALVLGAMAAPAAQGVNTHHFTVKAPAYVTGVDETGEPQPEIEITTNTLNPYSFKCEVGTYTGTLSEETNKKVTLVPAYDKCQDEINEPVEIISNQKKDITIKATTSALMSYRETGETPCPISETRTDAIFFGGITVQAFEHKGTLLSGTELTTPTVTEGGAIDLTLNENVT
jgi:hypothetical protein